MAIKMGGSLFSKIIVVIGSIFIMFMLYTLINEITLQSSVSSTIETFKEKLSQMKSSLDPSVKNYQYEKSNKNTQSKAVPCEVNPINDAEEFFQYGKHPNIKCKNLKEIGKRIYSIDGTKFACFDDRFNFKIENCMVLSFGLGGNWDFEEDMIKFGCTVHGFDPTINIDRSPKKVEFKYHNLGLSDVQGMIPLGGQLCKVDRYENIINMLDLNNTTIDYLKMDIEGSEIQFLKDVFKNSIHLLKNINQIGMEIHNNQPPASGKIEDLRSSNFGIYWELIQKLECEGFRLAHYEKNRVTSNHFKFNGRTESYCYEVLWIRK